MKLRLRLNANHLKLIAIIAMTIDHVSDLIYPGFPAEPGAMILHIVGRLTAPIMWFFVCEGYYYTRNVKMKDWIKNTLIFVLVWSAFPADWSCIAVLAILEMYKRRGNLNAQMKQILLYAALYAAVSFFFVSKVFALMQIGVLLVYPVLKLYNGEKGDAKWMKWFFYLYYPIHLIVIGVLRVCIYGDVSLLF